MKTILGLDLGTNSIGWAKVCVDDNGNYLRDIKLGSRIIPMSQDVLGNFDKGVTESQTSVRTGFRGVRRIRERSLLRRERLHRVLHVLGYLPPHYDSAMLVYVAIVVVVPCPSNSVLRRIIMVNQSWLGSAKRMGLCVSFLWILSMR